MHRTRGTRIRIALVTGLVAMAALAASLPSSASSGAAARFAKPEPAADYRFGNTLQSSIGEVPDLIDVGPKVNTFGTDVVAGSKRAVYQFPRFNGVELSPASAVISRNHFTIAILMRFEKVDGYRRIINFAKNAEDYGLYVYNGRLEFYDSASGTDAVINAGEWVQVVLTRSKSGEVKGYVDGVLQFTVDDSSDKYAVINQYDMLRFFRDDSNREESAGAVARIRLFTAPLSEARVADLSELKPFPNVMTDPFSAAPGDTISVDVTDFGPFETVQVVFRDSTHGWWRIGGEAVTDREGNATITATIRNNATVGSGRIMARGLTSDLKRAKDFTFVTSSDQ